MKSKPCSALRIGFALLTAAFVAGGAGYALDEPAAASASSALAELTSVDVCKEVAEGVIPKSISPDEMRIAMLACCKSAGEQLSPVQGPGDFPTNPVTSSSFPCPDGPDKPIPYSPEKEDAMEDLADQLNVPMPSCTGGCSGALACTPTGITSPGNDNVDLTIEADPNKPGYCRYSAKVFKTDTTSLSAKCGCI
ncbi:MAG TPA: hypothetical protein VN783_10535 [Thermoanaerobaculia bacterium]|nr:hypothetical protein [Thermoanaerobaculia bacterium]